ncbi:hypothetical protein UlMin_019360 [Ulmus minor]
MGLVSAIEEVLPGCTHRCCCHHILQNFQKKFRQTGLRDFFWEAAKAPNFQEFQIAMSKIKEENGEAYEWLNLMEARIWAFHAMDKNVKSNMWQGVLTHDVFGRITTLNWTSRHAEVMGVGGCMNSRLS